MTDDEDHDVIDPLNLDPDTLRKVEMLVREFPDSSPASPSNELTEYRAGRRDAFAAVLAVITNWLDDIEHDTDRDSGDNDLMSEE